MKQKFTVVSLFSGAMGLDIGLEATERFNLIACVEKIPAFCDTIRRNRDAGHISNKDMHVYAIDIDQLEPEQLMADLKLAVGDLDLLVGGPPCQSFSTTGKRGTVQDPRGTLLWRYLHFIEVLQPKFFLMENVRGLMSAALKHRAIADRPDKGGADLHEDELPGSVVQRFISDLHGAYRVDCFEVNAVNYGAPQLRERAIFIGNRYNCIVEFPKPTHGHAKHEPAGLFDNESELKPYRTLGDALEGLSEESPVIIDFSPRKKNFLSMIPPGGNWRCLPEHIAKESMGKAFIAKGGRSGWWRRLSLDLPCPTIVTLPNHASTSLCHPSEVRALTLRECARVQEFPDYWEFCGTPVEQYAQVGNAVPVRLGQVAGEVIAQRLAELQKAGFQRHEGQHQMCRVVYLQSHVRTRQWYKNGKRVIWNDGEGNDEARYSPAKTARRVNYL